MATFYVKLVLAFYEIKRGFEACVYELYLDVRVYECQLRCVSLNALNQ